MLCSDIDSLSVAGVEATGLTTFEQEACSSVDALGKHYKVSPIVAVDDRIQNLTEYFSRPRCIASGTVPTTRGIVYSTILSPSTILTNLFSNGAARMEGVYGYRCSFVFTIQLAAHPFHGGLLAACFQYGPNSNYQRHSQTYSCTNLPHVLLDVSETTMVKLKVPFNYIFEYLMTDATLNYRFGTFSLNSILPIELVAGTTSPRYTVYVHMEDLEFFGSTSQDIGTILLQSGGVEGDEEAAPYSKVPYRSRALRMFRKGIPFISGVPRPISSTLSMAADLAKSFGYSKPHTNDPYMRMYPTSSVAETNTDLVTPCAVVGPFSSTAISPTPALANTDIDEMSIEYILSQWSQLMFDFMPNTRVTGDYIYGCVVSPSAMWYRELAPNVAGNIACPLQGGLNYSAFFPSHVFNLTSFFRSWRGGFRFRVTFGKTKFHVGRILMSYEPTVSQVSIGSAGFTAKVGALVSGNPQPFVYSKIFDFRDGNVVEFDVPYISLFPYSTWFENIGTFSIAVMNPLDGPTTVPTRIPFLIEVKCLPGFEVAVPRTPLYPASPLAAPSAIKLQSGGLQAEADFSVADIVFGERVHSIKTLLSIPYCGASCSLPNGSLNKNITTIFPWNYHPPIPNTTPNTTQLPYQAFSYGGNWATCFLYCKGATEVHVYYNSTGTTQSMRATIAAHPNEFASVDPATFGTVQAGACAANPRVIANGNESLHAIVPNFFRFPRMYTNIFNSITWDTATVAGGAKKFPVFYDAPVQVPVLSEYSPTTTVTRWMSRAAADDAALGMYMGPVPLYIPGSPGGPTVYDFDGLSVLGSSNALT